MPLKSYITMKKSSSLFRLAERFCYKYAGVDAENMRSQVEDAIWTALHNASGNKVTGIMPFVQMAKKDGVTVSFDVTRTDHFSGSPTFNVENVQLEPVSIGANLLPTYQPVAKQIEDYLGKNPELYPSVRSGVDINYKNFTIHLTFPKPGYSPVAQK
jgi:hypothetical protein